MGSFAMDSNVEEQTSNVQNFYLQSLLSVNYSTPKPNSEYIVWQDPEAEQKLVEIVGILAALAISAMIIVGVAFIMSKLRKRNVESHGSDQTVSEVQLSNSSSVPNLNNNQLNVESGVPHYSIKHVYSISGLKWDISQPAEKRNLKQILTPKFLKRKPQLNELPTVHDKFKKDLNMIYVY